MTRTVRRTLTGLGAAALLCGGVAATAQAGPNESASGSVTSPGVNFTFNASNDANGSSSGTFTGEIRLGLRVMQAQGPVTCLEVEGNKVGIFYPITTSSPSLVGSTGSFGVYMNITTDGQGNARSISYSMVPKQTGGCKPAPTFIPASGTVTTTGG